MLRNSPGSVRAALIRDPGDAAACGELIRRLDEPRAAFRWFCRLALLAGGDVLAVDGDVLRKAMLSTRAIETDALRRTINGIDLEHPVRGMFALFFSAALLATGHLDVDALSRRPLALRSCRDNFEKVVGLLSRTIETATASEAFNLSVLKHCVVMILRAAGFMDAMAAVGLDLSHFYRTTRRRFDDGGTRVFSWRWTFAIGHLAIAAFMVKGQDAGILDFRRSKVWDGRMANRALRSRLLALSPNVELVPPGTMFAETFGAYLREPVDGRLVDLFEACGIVADRAGDERGAILERPSADDPVLARFRAAAGIRPDARIVTLHCREPGFRADGLQDLRNVEVASYLPAVRDLVERGYVVVRVGDPSMTPLPPMDGVFDYALSPLKSDDLDILLLGAARFHVGSSSGLSQVPLLFGTPCLSLNWHSCELLPWGRRNWTVLKPITRLADGRRVTDWPAYSAAGRLHSRRLLNGQGHDIAGLTAAEVRRAVADYATMLEHGDTEPARTGRNLGRVILADDRGDFHDVAGAVLAGSGEPAGSAGRHGNGGGRA